MSAVGWRFEMKIRIPQGCGSGKGRLVQQGIVHGIHQQAGHSNVGQVGQGGGAGPVIFSSVEAVERGGDVFVEVADGADFGKFSYVDGTRELPGFSGGFG